MQALLHVIVPVFLVIGAGYVAVWSGLFGDATIDELMRFATNFAIPCLLFLGVVTLDLGQNFNLAMLGSFYAGATASFVLGLSGARFLFGRSWEDSVVIGFVALFSNSVMLGLSIVDRAYGAGPLANSVAIVSVHAAFCYTLGITVMETVLSRGRGILQILRRVIVAIVRNALMIGIALGFAWNIAGLPLPAVLQDGLEFVVRAALPVALFAIGGVLYRYRPEGDMRLILFVCALSLLMHPALTWMLGRAAGLTEPQFRAAVLTATMGPGVNGYIFANLYGRAKRVAASSVLIATALSVLTIWVWLHLLG